MDSAYRRELEVAIGAVRQAARISQALLDEADKGTVEKEGDLGPVTVGDFAIQALLTASLQRAFPEDSFVGEESAEALRSRDGRLRDRVWQLLEDRELVAVDGERVCIPASAEAMCDLIDRCQAAPGRGRVWVFDPIDGTRTFVKRQMYAINVALLVDGKQMVGVVGCPLLSAEADVVDQGGRGEAPPTSNATVDPTGRGCLLYAVRSHGVYVETLLEGNEGSEGNKRKPARRLQRHAAADAQAGVQAGEQARPQLRPVTSHEMQTSAVEEVHRQVAARLGVPFPGVDLLGWVPRWASLALGLANMTVWVYRQRSRHAKLWDHAGAMLLFEEVGGIITDVDGRPLDLLAGRTMSNNFGFVAAAADVHADVLRVVQEVLCERGL